MSVYVRWVGHFSQFTGLYRSAFGVCFVAAPDASTDLMGAKMRADPCCCRSRGSQKPYLVLLAWYQQ